MAPKGRYKRMQKEDWLSYLFPIQIERRVGQISPFLEVTKHRGKFLLNSRHVNYSFGGLHAIFNQLFRETEIRKFPFTRVLILGMGAGSVVSLLRDNYGVKAPITAVEADEVVIELARKYFELNRHKDVEVIHVDAFDFVKNAEETYDLIITDLFIDEEVPDKFATKEFLGGLKRICAEPGCVIYNKMTEAPIHKEQYALLFENFRKNFGGARTYELYAGNSQNSLMYVNTF